MNILTFMTFLSLRPQSSVDFTYYLHAVWKILTLFCEQPRLCGTSAKDYVNSRVDVNINESTKNDKNGVRKEKH